MLLLAAAMAAAEPGYELFCRVRESADMPWPRGGYLRSACDSPVCGDNGGADTMLYRCCAPAKTADADTDRCFTKRQVDMALCAGLATP